MLGNKNKNIFSKYCRVSAAVIASFFIMAALFATPVKAITISQLNLEIVARPGETIEELVQLYDESFTGATVYPVVFNFTEDPSSEGSALILTDPADLKPDRSWIQWNADEVAAAGTDIEGSADTVEEDTDEETTEEEKLLYGNEELPLHLPVAGLLADFPYRIVVPQDAEPGTHLISLVFQLKPAEQTDTEGAAIYIGSNVAVNIFLKVLGATIDDIDVDFQSGVYSNNDPELSPAERKAFFEPKNFFLKPPVDFLVTMINNGNTHQKPEGNIKIVNDLFGSRTEEIQVNEINRIILPSTDRTFEVESFGQGFMFGKYRAKITLLYGDPLKPVQKEIAFWIVPLVEILIVLGVILVIVIIIIIIRKKRKKGRVKKEVERDEKMRQQIVEELQGKKKPVNKDNNGQKKGKSSKGSEDKGKSRQTQKKGSKNTK